MAHGREHKKLSDDPVVRGHETSDINAKSILISGVALSIGVMVFGILLSWGVYQMYKSMSPNPDAPALTLFVPDSSALQPLPRLQTDPHLTLIPFVRSQDSVLASYGWINGDSSSAKIPIERAMKIIVEQGLPVQSK